jgi:iron complex outermembrane receptor protein
LVRAQQADTGAPLNGIPPDQLNLELIGRPPPLGRLRSIELAFGTDLVATQSRVEIESDFAPPPPGYVLLHLRAEGEIALRDQSLRIGLDAANLTNTAYRDYTSLLRYYADQAGLDIRVRIGMDF